VLKARLNQGLTSNLYFWRDQTGNEVDVLVDEGDCLCPIEIKSGQTVAADWLKSLTRWQQLAGSRAGVLRLVYGGELGVTRSGVELVPWRVMGRL
jgi:uncharacterized protein